MNKGYNFPFNNGGINHGINNSGIETFKGSPKYYLTKETIQNSLDARDDTKHGPVRVEFKLKNLIKNKFPYIDDLKKIIKECMEFWKEDNKTEKFMKKAIDVLEKETIPILEVSDYNTTGLIGAKEKQKGCFNNLVKSSGVSNKDENAGGSFGIGKNAPFTCSDLRTVIYSTLDNENVLAVQGVSNLVTHKRDNRLTQGTGFLGIEIENEYGDAENLPFLDNQVYENIDEYFIRKEVGTSVFITGFDIDEKWKDEIIQATIDYYFVAIIDKKLEVKVDDILINDMTIGDILEDNKEIWKNKLTLDYYKALTNKPDKNKFYIIENKDFEGLGKIKLYLYLDDNLLKKIAYVRSNGMKIIDKDRFRVTTEFTGVLKFEGIKINKFIKSLENPSHDKIEYERYENKNYAKNVLDKLRKWIKDEILKLDKFNPNEAIDAYGIGEFLPQDSGQSKLNISIKDIVNKNLEDINIKTIKTIKKASKKIKSEEGTPKDKPEVEGKNRRSNYDNDNSKIKPIDICKSRIFCTDDLNSKYRVLIKGNARGNTYIQFKIICEEGYEIAQIKSVIDSKNGHAINTYGNKFGPVRFKKGEERIFDVILDSTEKYAMEVIENANNL
ncbi:hypothetical protein DP144_13940 [Clostridium tetani]|uniref:hypothetical protein n=1 Tax=Clostridium tetani TaxID=1513 RepID=UPI00100A765E|nr:hypothetical protein [Clostridium tetani]RXM73688.1 hypothetical protein DP154_13760 [Clostridium tetani]RYU97803.1 hypothetical protein DP144_13940 [Clostridium tetani]